MYIVRCEDKDKELNDINIELFNAYKKLFKYKQNKICQLLNIQNSNNISDYQLTDDFHDYIFYRNEGINDDDIYDEYGGNEENEEKEEKEENEENEEKNKIIARLIYDNNEEEIKVNSQFIKNCTLLSNIYNSTENSNEDLKKIYLPKNNVPLHHLIELINYSSIGEFSKNISIKDLIDTADFLQYNKAFMEIKKSFVKEIINRRLPLDIVKSYLEYYPNEEERHDINMRFFCKFYKKGDPDNIIYV